MAEEKKKLDNEYSQEHESNGETRRLLDEQRRSADKASRKADDGIRDYGKDARAIPL